MVLTSGVIKSRVGSFRPTSTALSDSHNSSSSVQVTTAMPRSDTKRVQDQNQQITRLYGPLRVSSEQCAVGWKQLQCIGSAQQLSDLSNIPLDQLRDIQQACSSLLDTGNKISTVLSLGLWSSEQRGQLDLLLHAASNGLKLYADAHARGQLLHASELHVVTELLGSVTDILVGRFYLNTNRVLSDAEYGHLTCDILSALHPALPASNSASASNSTAVPGEGI